MFANPVTPATADIKHAAWKTAVWDRLRQVEADVDQSVGALGWKISKTSTLNQNNGTGNRKVEITGAPDPETEAPGACALIRKVYQFIEAADECLDASGKHRYFGLDFLTGNLLMSAYANLHAAERNRVLLFSESQLAASLPSIRCRAAAYLKVDDPVRLALDRVPDITTQARQTLDQFQQQVTGPPPELAQMATQLTPMLGNDQRIAAEALGAAFAIEDQQQGRVRRFRSVLFGTFFALLILVAILSFLGFHDPRLISLCVNRHAKPGRICPSGRGKPKPADMSLILGFGGIGASLAVARHLTALKLGVRYSLSVAEGLLKVALGAITAVLGILLLRTQTEFVGILATQAGILTAAVVFGYGQQLFTGLIDRRATVVLDAASPLASRSAALTRGDELAGTS
jgi:hypothetical protein